MPIHVLFGWMIARFCCVSGLELRAAVAGKGAPFRSPIREIAGQRAVPGSSRPFGESGGDSGSWFPPPGQGPERVGTTVAWAVGFGLESAGIEWWTCVCPLFREVDWLGEAAHCFGYAPHVGIRRLVARHNCARCPPTVNS
jgi:hypothetical protein